MSEQNNPWAKVHAINAENEPAHDDYYHVWAVDAARAADAAEIARLKAENEALRAQRPFMLKIGGGGGATIHADGTITAHGGGASAFPIIVGDAQGVRCGGDDSL